MSKAKTQPPKMPAKVGAFLEDVGATKAELWTIAHLMEGLNNREIGERLNVGERTVKFHLLRVNRKIGVKTRLQLVVKLARMGYYNVATAPSSLNLELPNGRVLQ